MLRGERIIQPRIFKPVLSSNEALKIRKVNKKYRIIPRHHNGRRHRVQWIFKNFQVMPARGI